MEDGKFTFFLIVHLQSLCQMIKEEYKVEYKEARKMLYNSKLYSALEKEDTKMWYFSKWALFDFFNEEMKTGNYTLDEG